RTGQTNDRTRTVGVVVGREVGRVDPTRQPESVGVVRNEPPSAIVFADDVAQAGWIDEILRPLPVVDHRAFAAERVVFVRPVPARAGDADEPISGVIGVGDTTAGPGSRGQVAGRIVNSRRAADIDVLVQLVRCVGSDTAVVGDGRAIAGAIV